MRRRVLLVEDEHSVRDVLALFLTDAYDVEGAATAAQALVVLRRESVAAVILDHKLPDRFGLEILPEIHSLRPDVPIIMITGFGSEGLCASAFKLGIKDYLPKPVRGSDLVAAVHRALGAPPEVGRQPEHGEPSPRPWTRMRRSSDGLIRKAAGLINERYWDDLRLSTLAREVGLSRYRLSHRFTEVMGLPFRQYLLIVRLERSKELLATGNASITEVAQAVGFSDLPRFDKLFKRYTGFTPSGYRARLLA